MWNLGTTIFNNIFNKGTNIIYDIAKKINAIDRYQYYQLAICIAILNKKKDKNYKKKIENIIKVAKKHNSNFEEIYLFKYKLPLSWHKDKIKNIASIIFINNTVIGYSSKFKKLNTKHIKLMYQNDLLDFYKLIEKTDKEEESIYYNIYDKKIEKHYIKNDREKNKINTTYKEIEDVAIKIQKNNDINYNDFKFILDNVSTIPSKDLIKKGSIEILYNIYISIENKNKSNEISKKDLKREILELYENKIMESKNLKYFITLLYKSLISSAGCYSIKSILEIIFNDREKCINYYNDLSEFDRIENIFDKFNEKIKNDKSKENIWKENFDLWKKTIPSHIIARMF